MEGKERKGTEGTGIKEGEGENGGRFAAMGWKEEGRKGSEGTGIKKGEEGDGGHFVARGEGRKGRE